MPVKYENELRQRAEQFITALQQGGIAGSIVPGSFRDYQVKVAIQRDGHLFGHVNLYYSPTKNHFSLKYHELREQAIVPEVTNYWEKSYHSALSYQSVSTNIPQIYVDGSYINDAIGYGLVMLRDNQVIDELSGAVVDDTLQDMHQVAGELRAVYEAIAWCQANHIQEVDVFYDYEGIKKWATGEWKANKPATQAYASAAQTWGINIQWHKVESHTGNRWNEHADQLAKRGAGRTQQESASSDPISTNELAHKAEQFIEFLVQHKVKATFQGVINSQFARVVIEAKQGILDIYNTRRRSLAEPYLHDFREPSLKDQVAGLWQAFLSENTAKVPDSNVLLSQATHYYGILEPYRDCAFDFVDLAAVLLEACKETNQPSFDIEAVRYDFTALEHIYIHLYQ